jgi:ribosomal protein S18 acetylase RimI-like enzyme
VKLSKILREFSGEFEIVPWTDEDYDTTYDPWVAADQADAVASKSGIRISSDKELASIALVGDDVVGAVWTSLTNDEPPVFDFDVAVDPDFRGTSRVGLKLIDSAVEDLRSHQGDFHGTSIRVWVINPKLVRVLENRYGFEIESQYEDGSAHMTFA